jgi:glycosyltransferase involved in cell wall biosynthesis
MPKTRILFYYLVLKNTDRPLAGTSTAMLRATARLAAETDAFDLTLCGDQVARPEFFADGRRIVPLPPPEARADFLAGFDIVVLASHMAALDPLPKPPGQKWILLQHCWDLMPDIPARLAEFDAVIASSAMHREHLLLQGVPADRLTVIANFLDTGAFAPAAEAPSPLSLAYAGALVPHKGVHILVEAMRQVAAAEPGASLDVFGAQDMWLDFEAGYEQRLRRAAAGLPVRFLGAVPTNDQMPGVFQGHGIFCLPSMCETFPLTVLEAQACGCIPVAHDGGGTAAALRHGDTGFLYAPNTPEALARAILTAVDRLRRDPAMRGRAVEHIRRHFDGAEQTRQLRGLLASL